MSIHHHHVHTLDHATRRRVDSLIAALDNLSLQLSAIPSLSDSIANLAEKLDQLSRPDPIFIVVAGQSIHFPGLKDFQGEDMNSYTVPRDHADEPFELSPLSIADSEGPVDIPFTEVVESDNTDVVSIVDGALAVHFGTNGGANVSRKVTLTPPGATEPATFIAGSAVFNVTFGALIVTGDINFPGLTPDAPPA